MKNKQKSVKFEFYQCNIIKDSDKKTLNLSRLIDKIYSLNLEKRYKNYYGEGIRLDRYKVYDDKLIYFRMTRLKNEGVSKSKVSDDDYTDIDLMSDEFIVQDIGCIYDSNHSILMIQRNASCLSVKGLTFYFSEFIKDFYDENSDLSKGVLELDPVIDKDRFRKLEKMKDYRKIELATASKNKVSDASIFLKKINSFFGDTIDSYSGYRISLSISAEPYGRSLRTESSKKLSDEILDDKSMFDVANIYGREEDSSVEVVDLINGKLFTTSKFNIIKSEHGVDRRMHLDSAAVEEKMHNIYMNDDYGNYRMKVLHNIS